jgi:rubrerythrin
MKALAQFNRDKLIDLLTERLTFERTGVELYDKVLEHVQASSDPEAKSLVEPLQHFRDEEKDHEEWLEDQIRDLGGDAHGKTELSELVTIESRGVADVIMDGADVAHDLHALLTAELADNAGWELLCDLARQAGDHEAQNAFSRYKKEEDEHLQFVRSAVEQTTARKMLGQKPLSAPPPG